MTTPRFKDFGSGGSRTEPITFKIHGEDFECYPEIQGKYLMQIMADSTSADPAAQTELVFDFFARVMKPESHERFNALLEDKERIVHVDTLTEIVTWLMEEYSDRPEEQPEDSSTGQ
jgi:hypothetical protein